MLSGPAPVTPPAQECTGGGLPSQYPAEHYNMDCQLAERNLPDQQKSLIDFEEHWRFHTCTVSTARILTHMFTFRSQKEHHMLFISAR
jgi:hypothetical protein